MHDFFGLIAPEASIGKRTDDDFRRQRRQWNCMLSPDFLKTVVGPSLHKLTIQIVEIWQMQVAKAPNRAFSANNDIRKATLAAMWQTVVGTDLALFDRELCEVNSYSNGTNSAVPLAGDSSTCQRVYRALLDIFFCLDWVTTGVSPSLYSWIFKHTYILPRAERIVDQSLSDQIKIARDRITSKHATGLCALDRVLSKIAQSNSEQDLQYMSDELLKDEVMELLVTGHETTASSIQWALKYLADNQHAQVKLHQELQAAFEDVKSRGMPSSSAIMDTRLPYLEAVIWETLRLSCTGPVSFRETTRECELQNALVPAGTTIILVTSDPMLNRGYTTGRKTGNLECDNLSVKTENLSQSSTIPLSDFEPARWLRPDGSFDPQACDVLPFSAGPRGCFGKQIALLELRMMLAIIFLTFRLPKLPLKLSRYHSRDSLTRRPTCCYVMPKLA